MSISSLHDPSSAVAPPTTSHGTSQPSLQSEIQRLTLLKDSLTASLEVYFSVLSTNKVTMQTPLIDPEGFPRSDIDVAGVRTARVQIIRLRNDLKDCMSEMETLVQRGLGKSDESAVQEGQEEMKDEEEETGSATEGRKPFAKVDGVFPGGPADAAGIKRDDQVLSIGSVDATNHDSLRAVAALVGSSEGIVLPLSILRDGQTLSLRLTPRSGWGGRGLLGCHIVPV